LSALAALTMIGGLAGTITQAERATRQASIAEEQRNRADEQARAATEQRDFAVRQLSRAEALNDFNAFLLSDAAPSGKPFTAGELLSRAEAIIDRQHDESDANRAEMLVAIGRQFRIMDRDDEARRLLSRAYDIAQKLPDRTTRARAACNLASAVARAGERERAETLFREGMAQLPQEAQYTLDRIACLLEGGTIAREGNLGQAVARTREAQALLPQLPYRSSFLEMRVLMDLAESYRMAANNPEALATFELVYAKLVALGRENTETAGTIYNNWALALDITGQMLKAEALFRRAIRMSSDEASDRNVSPMLLTNLARVLIRLEHVDEATRLVDQAYERARAAGDATVVRDSLLVRAMAYRELGDLARAETLLNDAEARYRSTRPPECACFATFAFERAGLAQAHGDSSAATAWADKGVSIAQSDPLRRNVSPYFLLLRAELALEQNRFDAAKADAAKSIELNLPALVPGTQSSYLGRAYLSLGRALIATGHADDARDALSAAAEHLRPSLGADHSQTKLADKLLATTVASSR
jgi:tetratricopeptide (TPR) repeat protein